MAIYQVAVCEDDPLVCRSIARQVRAIYKRWQFEARVREYTSATTLREELAAGTSRFDLFLLDIEMPELDGLELARWLYACGARDCVVFITGNPEHALAGYSAHPLHYLLKPVSDAQIEEVLRLARDIQQPPYILLENSQRSLNLPISEVRYIESSNHGINIALADGVRFFRVGLREIEQRLPAASFARCHRSYLVNLAWAERTCRYTLILRDGTNLPISRSCRAEFQSALVRYLNKHDV